MNYKQAILFLFAVFVLFFFAHPSVKFLSILFIVLNIILFLYSRLLYLSVYAFHNSMIIRAYKNKNITVEMTLLNRSVLPLHYIFIEIETGQISFKDDVRFLIKLKPLEKRNISFAIMPLKRGEYQAGPVSIRGSDPFGFFSWEKRIDSFCKIIVYPEIFDMSFHIKDGVPAGSIKTDNRLYEDITQFRSLRPYVPGDDIKKINWKVSAKLASLHTAEYVSSLNSSVMMLLNLNFGDYPSRNRLEHLENAVETASSMLYYFTGKKQDTGLISTGIIEGNYVCCPFRSGYDQAVMILEMLARIRYNENEAGKNSFDLVYEMKVRLPYRSRLIYITPVLKDHDYIKVLMLKKEGLFIDIVFIRDAKALPDEKPCNMLNAGCYNTRIEEKKIVYERRFL